MNITVIRGDFILQIANCYHNRDREEGKQHRGDQLRIYQLEPFILLLPPQEILQTVTKLRIQEPRIATLSVALFEPAMRQLHTPWCLHFIRWISTMPTIATIDHRLSDISSLVWID